MSIENAKSIDGNPSRMIAGGAVSIIYLSTNDFTPDLRHDC